MKYVLIFLVAFIFVYLMAAFGNLEFNPLLWDKDSRGLLFILGTVIPTAAVFLASMQQEVIVRDPKTGRFKKK